LLVIRQNEEALAEEFKQFLLQQMNVPRVLRCQIADDDGGILTTSLYCGETYTIQQAFFNKRVHKMFRENDLAKISTYMNMSLDNQREESFVVKEFIFERIVDCLLRNEKISEEEASQFPAGFLEALEEKKGKLNTLFDYRFSNGQAEINSFLYVTKENQTWIIQQGNEDHLVIQPFSFAQFLQLTSTATNG
ncbi:MAG TPA: hypothetical protein VEY51_13675, partial [Chondromyces sp.]|nr:hypothetical protein [Chondromyces sp.]